MVVIGGERVKLVEGKDNREEAERLFHELMAGMARTPESASARTVDLVEAFLQHSRVHFAEDTHRINRYYCQLLAEACGKVPARDIKPYHIDRWIDPKVAAGEWSETTVYNARRCAHRVFSWAAQRGLIASNPLAGMPRPKPAPRQRAITDGEFWKLYDYAGGPLRDLLLALYLTGARLKEVRDLRWDQVYADGRWVLKEHKTRKKTSAPRVIYPPQVVKELVDRLRGNGHTHVFLNTYGKPWTMNALRLQMSRLRKKLGLPEDLVAYLCRHGFGTRAILNGVDGKTLAELMGHSSTEMINTVYVHLADQHAHLKEAVEKVNASPTPLPDASGPVRKRARPVSKKKEGEKPSSLPPAAS
jgi:integrase